MTFGYSTRSGTSCSSDCPPACRDDAAAAAPRFAVELARDAFLPFAALEDDEVLGEPLAIVVEPFDLDRAAGAAARRQEAMAERDRSRSNLLDQRPLRAAACDRPRTGRPGRRRETESSESAGRTAARPCRRRASRPTASPSGTSARAAARSARRAARRPPLCRDAASGTRDRCPSASRAARARATSTPCFLAKPNAAGVGWPLASKAADTGGPVSSSSKSVCRSASLPMRAVSRRGVL